MSSDVSKGKLCFVLPTIISLSSGYVVSGFSEIVSHKASAATDADRRLMTDATRKRGLDEPCPEPAGSRTDALTGQTLKH